MSQFSHKLFLTFDVEDFINDRSIGALRHILGLLNEHYVRALFFVTGHMMEKLQNYRDILDELRVHEVGYHSTSHSIHPNIFEYTDVMSYKEAYDLSLSREISHINPVTGETEGKGGLELVKKVFSNKKVEAFRAPGFSWSPPHLEALRDLGIRYDFSTNISKTPVHHKGLTFFPFPVLIDSMEVGDLSNLLRSILREKVAILDFHPNFFVNKIWWDSCFFKKSDHNNISTVPARSPAQTQRMFSRLETVLKAIKTLESTKMVGTDNARTSEKKLDVRKTDVQKVHDMMIQWPIRRFNYTPKFVRSHLLKFFGLYGTDNQRI